jgi:hypothetical protein
MKYIRDVLKDRPYVSKDSQHIFNKVAERESLSNDFLKRNIEFAAQSKM